jgi:hypothetical protein
MNWRRLNPGELDHELIWLSVSALTALLAGAWLYFALPLPRCAWHDLTGLPCPTCGATRCVRFLTQGAWKAALLINPLVFLGFASAAIYNVYAALVVVLRLPRLRFDRVPPRFGNMVRYGFLIALAVNWLWLVYRHI